MMLILLLILALISFAPQPTYAATLTSPNTNGFVLETNVSLPPKPTPTSSPFEPIIKNGSSPVRLTISGDLIDFGPLSPTNHIKRLLYISVSAQNSMLYTYQNHSLQTADGHNIPDTTCDDGICSEALATTWINPFTFGLGFSLGDENVSSVYQQFADLSKGEILAKIPPGKIIIKLNVDKNTLPQGPNFARFYENTIIFQTIPKY